MITVILGVTLTVVLHCWITGVMGDMIDNSARFTAGHVKITTAAYAEMMDQAPNDLALLDISVVLDELKSEHADLIWAPRILFGGLLDIPDEHGETRSQATVAGWGIEILKAESGELDRFNIRNALERGSLPSAPGEILISDDLARRLDVEPGQEATLMGSTMHGSMSFFNFTIAGTVSFGVAALDRGAIIADLNDVQQALDMHDAAGEILGYFGDERYQNDRASALAEQFNSLQNKDDEFAPFMLTLREQAGLASMLEYMRSMIALVVTIFVGAMALVLWNTGLIGGIRRYHEIGVRLAVGENKRHIYTAMIIESLLVGVAGSAIGTLIGLSLSFFLQHWGINTADLMQNSSMMIPGVLRAQITPAAAVIGFVPGLFATVFGTMLSGIGIYKRNTAQLFKELEA